MTTHAGRNLNTYIAQKVGAKQPLVFDEIIFIYRSGLTAASLNNAHTFTNSEIKARVTPVAGYAAPDTVIYSALLDSDVGDFDFNAVILRNKTDNQVALKTFTGTQSKKRSTTTQQGNALVRNFILEFDGAQAATKITQAAQAWQFDFTQRLDGIDEFERLANMATFGALLSVNGALVFNPYPAGTGGWIKGGRAYVCGLPVEINFNATPNEQNYTNAQLQSFFPTATNGTVCNVILKAVYTVSANSKGTAVGEIVFDKARRYPNEHGEVTENGQRVFYARIGQYRRASANEIAPGSWQPSYFEAQTSVVNEIKKAQQAAARAQTTADSKWAAVNASTTARGIVQLNNTLTSTATDQALTAAQGRLLDIAIKAKWTAVNASTTARGIVQLNNTLTSTATDQALTANQGRALNNAIAAKWTAVDATTTRKGIVQLNNTLTSTSTAQALTAAQGRSLDLAIKAKWTAVDASITQKGIVQLDNTLVSTSTDKALTANGGRVLANMVAGKGKITRIASGSAEGFTHNFSNAPSSGICYLRYTVQISNLSDNVQVCSFPLYDGFTGTVGTVNSGGENADRPYHGLFYVEVTGRTLRVSSSPQSRARVRIIESIVIDFS